MTKTTARTVKTRHSFLRPVSCSRPSDRKGKAHSRATKDVMKATHFELNPTFATCRLHSQGTGDVPLNQQIQKTLHTRKPCGCLTQTFRGQRLMTWHWSLHYIRIISWITYCKQSFETIGLEYRWVILQKIVSDVFGTSVTKDLSKVTRCEIIYFPDSLYSGLPLDRYLLHYIK